MENISLGKLGSSVKSRRQQALEEAFAIAETANAEGVVIFPDMNLSRREPRFEFGLILHMDDQLPITRQEIEEEDVLDELGEETAIVIAYRMERWAEQYVDLAVPGPDGLLDLGQLMLADRDTWMNAAAVEPKDPAPTDSDLLHRRMRR